MELSYGENEAKKLVKRSMITGLNSLQVGYVT